MILQMIQRLSHNRPVELYSKVHTISNSVEDIVNAMESLNGNSKSILQDANNGKAYAVEMKRAKQMKLKYMAEGSKRGICRDNNDVKSRFTAIG